jgi:hypothetical protein
VQNVFVVVLIDGIAGEWWIARRAPAADHQGRREEEAAKRSQTLSKRRVRASAATASAINAHAV